ncbi:MAG: hypothetical protein LBQ22_01920 [Bacteroidales bacterium]|jgi:uncharacterized protein YceK|nr:hypothetical protein [Bacteroidales bacterium]
MRNFLLIIILNISTLFIFGCKTVEKTTESKEQINKSASVSSVSADSVIIWKHDSIFIYIAGDTVLKEVFRTQYRDRYHYDTLKIADSIYIDKINTIIKTEIKTTNILKWWQKTLIGIGIAAILIAVIKIYKQFS